MVRTEAGFRAGLRLLQTFFAAVLLAPGAAFAAKSAHIDNLDDAFADMPILLERKDKAGLETVMSNSFGFGGTNGALVMRRV